MTHDLRPVLEAVIFADDVTAAERLRAIEQLRQLDGERVCARCASFNPPPDPDGFKEHTDDLLSSLVPFLDARGEARMPLTTARMRSIVEREAEVRARVLADAGRIEREVRKRAEVLARELYEARSFGLVSQPESSEPVDPGEATVRAASGSDDGRGLPGDGFSSGHGCRLAGEASVGRQAAGSSLDHCGVLPTRIRDSTDDSLLSRCKHGSTRRREEP